jgi:hypothetical protein
MTHSKRLKPFMAYIENSQHNELTKYAKKARIPMSQIVREAIALRIAQGNPYVSGFNDGLKKAVALINANEAFQMTFPSGKSFAKLINDELESAVMEEHHETAQG